MRPPREVVKTGPIALRSVLALTMAVPAVLGMGRRSWAAASELARPASVALDRGLEGGAVSSAVAERPTAPAPWLGRFALTAGVRTDVVRSSGLDPFSDSDALAQSSLAARYVLSPPRGLGFGVGLDWDHGTFSSTARGAPTRLDTDRFSLTVEGRLPLVLRRLFAVARVAPGILRRTATLTDASIPNPPYASSSGLTASQIKSMASADASLGLELRLAELRPQLGRAIGFWLTGDAGYSYSAGRNLVLTPEGTAGVANRTDDPIRLGQLALRGFFFRFAAAVSF